MNPSPIQITEAVYQAFARRDVAAMFNLLSPDVEAVQSEELPWGGVYRGLGGAAAFFGKLTAHLDSQVDIERFIRSADCVTAIGWTHGIAKATGARFRVPFAHVWRIAEGRVASVQFLVDHEPMLAALAAPDAPVTT